MADKDIFQRQFLFILKATGPLWESCREINVYPIESAENWQISRFRIFTQSDVRSKNQFFCCQGSFIFQKQIRRLEVSIIIKYLLNSLISAYILTYKPLFKRDKLTLHDIQLEIYRNKIKLISTLSTLWVIPFWSWPVVEGSPCTSHPIRCYTI